MNTTPIEWTDQTLNPITGCTFSCPGCYAKRISTTRLAHLCKQFPTPEQVDRYRLDPNVSLCGQFFPHFHHERLKHLGPGQKPRRIFMDSMGDWWDHHVPQSWRTQTWNAMARCPQHVFQLLTKRPENVTEEDRRRIRELGNVWVGFSWDASNTTQYTRRDEIANQQLPHSRLWCSCEPVFGPYSPWHNVRPTQIAMQWLVLGAQTGPGAQATEQVWVERIIHKARRWNPDMPIFIKDNLIPVMGEGYVRAHQQWPEGMRLESDD